jgi:AAA domain
MDIQIRKAERVKSKLRLGLAGPSGSGKTMSALKVAKGIGGPVCLIDTERGSGDLYANLYDYSVISLEPPFKPDVLIEAIHAAEKAGFNVIIIDSLSHFWSDEGGILDQADKMQNSGKNRFTLWADLTPQHRRLVNAMLNSPKHIIGTMRSKQEYAMETDDKGKASVKKLGLAPVQREGMEYEFTVFFDISQDHYAKTTKDRTNMFGNEVFIMDEQTGIRLSKWLDEGRTDTLAMKREILGQLERLEIPVPTDKTEAREFIGHAIKKLTGIDLNDENLMSIVAALIDIEDKKKAHDAVFEAGKVEEQKAA